MDNYTLGSRKPGAGGDQPADLLRRKALGAGFSVTPPPLEPSAAIDLGAVDEDDESVEDSRAPPCGTISLGLFATPKNRSPVALNTWEAYWDQRLQLHLPSRCLESSIHNSAHPR